MECSALEVQRQEKKKAIQLPDTHDSHTSLFINVPQPRNNISKEQKSSGFTKALYDNPKARK